MADFHTYSSWGRTRRPKKLNNGAGASVSAVTIHDHNQDMNAIASTAAFLTENQRYLFVTVVPTANGTPGRDIEVWVSMHASDGTLGLLETIDCSGIAASESKIYKIEIAGLDFVAFRCQTGDDWPHANRKPSIHVSCSTF